MSVRPAPERSGHLFSCRDTTTAVHPREDSCLLTDVRCQISSTSTQVEIRRHGEVTAIIKTAQLEAVLLNSTLS